MITETRKIRVSKAKSVRPLLRVLFEQTSISPFFVFPIRASRESIVRRTKTNATNRPSLLASKAGHASTLSGHITATANEGSRDRDVRSISTNATATLVGMTPLASMKRGNSSVSACVDLQVR